MITLGLWKIKMKVSMPHLGRSSILMSVFLSSRPEWFMSFGQHCEQLWSIMISLAGCRKGICMLSDNSQCTWKAVKLSVYLEIGYSKNIVPYYVLFIHILLLFYNVSSSSSYLLLLLLQFIYTLIHTDTLNTCKSQVRIYP
jgi:hypothetical protein